MRHAAHVTQFGLVVSAGAAVPEVDVPRRIRKPRESAGDKSVRPVVGRGLGRKHKIDGRAIAGVVDDGLQLHQCWQTRVLVKAVIPGILPGSKGTVILLIPFEAGDNVGNGSVAIVRVIRLAPLILGILAVERPAFLRARDLCQIAVALHNSRVRQSKRRQRHTGRQQDAEGEHKGEYGVNACLPFSQRASKMNTPYLNIWRSVNWIRTCLFPGGLRRDECLGFYSTTAQSLNVQSNR